MDKALARGALMVSIKRLAWATGEAMWKSGYRCGAKDRLSDVDEAQCRHQELSMWKLVGDCEGAIERTLKAYSRIIRKQAVAKDGQRTLRPQQTKARAAGNKKPTQRSTRTPRVVIDRTTQT